MDEAVHIEPSEDQRVAFETLVKRMLTEKGSLSTLTGPAGSGKTTLLRLIIQYLEAAGVTVNLCTPTGKSAARLREVTGRFAITMHKALYGLAWTDRTTKRLHFGNPHPPCMPGEIIIVDEASMVDKKLFRDFQDWLPPDVSILYVGDKEQLPPVMSTWGPDLDNATVTLTKVHRQAMGNPIISYATAIREEKEEYWEENVYDSTDHRITVYRGWKEAVSWLIRQRRESIDATLLCYSHKLRRPVNKDVRERLGLADQIISVGDRLLVFDNNYDLGLMNGEVVTVKDVSIGDTWIDIDLEEIDEHVIVYKDLIESDRHLFSDLKRNRFRHKKNLIHIRYGQCLTVHASQGSQWSKVGFIEGTTLMRTGREFKRRLRYTAVTRAVDELAYIFSS